LSIAIAVLLARGGSVGATMACGIAETLQPPQGPGSTSTARRAPPPVGVGAEQPRRALGCSDAAEEGVGPLQRLLAVRAVGAAVAAALHGFNVKCRDRNGTWNFHCRMCTIAHEVKKTSVGRSGPPLDGVIVPAVDRHGSP
jgi:hypothetical protein